MGATLIVTEESRDVRNVPCVTYLGAENLCLVENAWGNITSDQMTMIKISFFPPFPPPLFLLLLFSKSVEGRDSGPILPNTEPLSPGRAGPGRAARGSAGPRGAGALRAAAPGARAGEAGCLPSLISFSRAVFYFILGVGGVNLQTFTKRREKYPIFIAKLARARAKG